MEDRSQREHPRHLCAAASRGTGRAAHPVAGSPRCRDYANSYTTIIGACGRPARRAGSDMMMGVIAGRARQRVPRYRATTTRCWRWARASRPTYDKRHLVPFGEYFPVPAVVRSWLRRMDLPNSRVSTAASSGRQTFQLAGLRSLRPASATRTPIRRCCAVRSAQRTCWSPSPTTPGSATPAARYQHLQIARMRALESRRYLLRAANDGVSAVIGPDGRVVARAPEFEASVLRAQFAPRTGDTPYTRAGRLAWHWAWRCWRWPGACWRPAYDLKILHDGAAAGTHLAAVGSMLLTEVLEDDRYVRRSLQRQILARSGGRCRVVGLLAQVLPPRCHRCSPPRRTHRRTAGHCRTGCTAGQPACRISPRWSSAMGRLW